MSRIHGALFALVFCALAGCSSTLSTTTVGTTPYAVWIAAVSTTYISDAPTDTATNFILQGDCLVKLWDYPGNVSHHVVSFVKFVLPTLPQGSTLDEAYFEMYHGGIHEDGTTDTTQFYVSQVGVPWGFDTMTWNKSPDHGHYFQPPYPIICQLHSADWCGTSNIADSIRVWFTNPLRNTGFRINLANIKNYYKSFYSNRTLTRTDSTLGLAPRLLLILHVPDTASLTPLKTFAQLPVDANVRLGAFSQRKNLVIMDSIAAGSDFPAAWNAKKGH